MHQLTVSENMTRVILTPEDAHSFSPVSFRDSLGEYLLQTGVSFSPRPVWRLSGEEGTGEIRQTANGEIISFDNGVRTRIRTVYSAVLTFSCPGSPILTGLGDGIQLSVKTAEPSAEMLQPLLLWLREQAKTTNQE